MGRSIEQRVAVVTGGGRGIGRGIVEALGSAGIVVVVNYRGDVAAAEDARRAAERNGAPATLAVQADVAGPDAGERLVEAALREFGRLDILVNNAGVAPEVRADLLECSPESFDRVVGTNLRGPFLLTQRVARTMVEQAGRGELSDPQVHFITSVSSTFASVNRGEYCVAKAGLSMVARLFAARLAEHAIRVFEIRPGVIETDMTAGVRDMYNRRLAEGLAPMRRWGTPSDVGRAVASIVAGSLPYATGAVIEIDGGLHIPRL